MASGCEFGVDVTAAAAEDGPGWLEWLEWLKRLKLRRLCLCQGDHKADGLRCEVSGKTVMASGMQRANTSTQ